MAAARGPCPPPLRTVNQATTHGRSRPAPLPRQSAAPAVLGPGSALLLQQSPDARRSSWWSIRAEIGELHTHTGSQVERLLDQLQPNPASADGQLRQIDLVRSTRPSTTSRGPASGIPSPHEYERGPTNGVHASSPENEQVDQAGACFHASLARTANVQARVPEEAPSSHMSSRGLSATMSGCWNARRRKRAG